MKVTLNYRLYSIEIYNRSDFDTTKDIFTLYYTATATAVGIFGLRATYATGISFITSL